MKRPRVVVRAGIVVMAYYALAWVLAEWCGHVRMYGLRAP